MKVLFLTSNLGSGHTRAADAVKHALIQRAPNCYCAYLDFWSLMDTKVAAAIKDGYLRLALHHSDYYQKLYDLDAGIWRQLAGEEMLEPAIADFLHEQQRRWFPEAQDGLSRIGNNLDQTLLNSLITRLCANQGQPSGKIVLRSLLLFMRRVLSNRLRDSIKAVAPDVVVSTQMYPGALYARLRANGEFPHIPALSIATDFGAQKVLAHYQTDIYCVGSEPLRLRLQQWSVPEEKIFVTGIPLMSGFKQPPSQDKARRVLNLPPAANTLLVIGGQYGIGIADAMSALVAEDNDYHIVVTACDALEDKDRIYALARAHRDRITLFDWFEDMSYLLSAADIVIGKPGGLSVSEALACGRPFLATCSLGGQERHNTQYLSQNQVGGTVKPAALTQILNQLFARERRCRLLQQRAYHLGHRHGADKIAGLVEYLYLSKCGIARYPTTWR